ncbi:MAG: hypothetical protein J2P36_23150, partial [Ktedonobacteraceae bacterium]|nr:hypothetical protein [Ktedonobacteraceae bacterium]
RLHYHIQRENNFADVTIRELEHASPSGEGLDEALALPTLDTNVVDEDAQHLWGEAYALDESLTNDVIEELLLFAHASQLIVFQAKSVQLCVSLLARANPMIISIVLLMSDTKADDIALISADSTNGNNVFEGILLPPHRNCS